MAYTAHLYTKAETFLAFLLVSFDNYCAMKIIEILKQRIEVALWSAGAPADCDALVSYSKGPEFGDYQANGVMSAAKRMDLKPRDLALRVFEQLDLSDLAEKVEIAGPGFINIFIKAAWLEKHLEFCKGDARYLLEVEPLLQRVVVDYSGPNLAKEMHVGHLRSTIIGDAMAKLLEMLGHYVIRQNHVGDWGTQFGMLITLLADEQKSESDFALADLEQFYRQAKSRFDQDPDFAERARNNVVALQKGDAHCLQLWQRFINQSMQHCFAIYQRLGVSLNESHTRAESAYNDDLPTILQALSDQKLLENSEGAQCVFLPGFETKEGNPLPVIVQKSDGAFLYATSDLAAIRYRCASLHADRILYFVDVRQSLHFKQVFALAYKAQFALHTCILEHMPFGTMLGEDKKPFKTRSGDLVKLEDLLDEAEQRAYQLVSEKQPELADAEKKRIARQVGIGAVKYADLSKNRTSDYVFNWDTMLSFEGNTAPYLQYAYARIQSIFRKLEIEKGSLGQQVKVIINEEAEKLLSLKLLQFNDIALSVAREGYPHYLCKYLYELTQIYMSFYERCPVLKAENNELQQSRLYLCALTASALRLGLDVLGIETPESM